MRVSLEQDPTPLVAAIAADLEGCLEDPAFAAATDRLQGLVGLSAPDTPQSVTVRLDAEGVSVAHGLDADADLTATLGPGAGRRIEGGEEHPELAAWLERLLDPPRPSWVDAGARFWAVLSKMPGAPDGLRLVNLDTAEERRFGSEDGRDYEIHGTADGLIDVLTGRKPLVDATHEGAVFIRGTFAHLSVLAGAGFAVRESNGAADD